MNLTTLSIYSANGIDIISYFCSKYNSPGSTAFSPSFEMKFARLEYVCDNNFKLAYMRHTEQCFEIYDGLSLEKCLEVIENDPSFMP